MASEPAAGRLIVAADRAEDAAWLARLPFASIGITPVFLRPSGVEWTPAATSANDSPETTDAPQFDAIDRRVRDDRVEACLLVGDGVFPSLTRVAADAAGVPAITIVQSRAHLVALGHRAKARPDLLLLATDGSPAEALFDARYGSTLVPVGRIGAATAPGAPDAAGRLLDAIDRWRRGTLEPDTPDLSVIVPAYRERENIALVCERLLSALAGVSAEILIVDDGSGDGTYERACEWMWTSPRIRAFSKPSPRGMGNAIRYGLDRARARIVGITMGDGSDEVAKIPEMLARVRDDGFGLAIGSRYRHRVNYAAVPGIYRFWSACFRACTRLLVGLRLSDYTNAFRVFDRRIFERVGPEGGGFEISPEITFKAWFTTGRVAEVDVRHLKRASGQSSFSFLRAGPGYGKMLTKAVIRRLTGRWFVLDW
jgi:hypothetical protein